MSVNINGIVLTEQAASVLRDLQKDNNDFIDIYDRHLGKITDLLFQAAGDSSSIGLSELEILKLLNDTHLLRKDLNALKTPDKRNSDCYQTLPINR